jgi:D-3-phosphoglycerate dehydrogenase/C-terminal binding protein
MSKQFKVAITDFIVDDLAPERDILGDIADVVSLNCFFENDLIGKIEDVDAIMLYHCLGLTDQTIHRLKNCKLIVRCGVGVDNVDHALASKCGIPVSNIPDYGTEEVADSAIALMMSLSRGTHQMNSLLQAGVGPWSYRQVVPLHRIRGRVFGVVGLGRIGMAAALRAKALGMDVVFYDPYKPTGYDKAFGIRRVEQVDELFAQSHVISFHCPLTDETYHMANRERIEKLPMGAFLINTARGGVVDAAVIPDMLVSGRLAGAGIDVLEQEPPLDDNPFITAWRNMDHPARHRLIVNPHLAFYSEEGLMDMRTKGSIAVRKALSGEPIPNVVNGVG